MPDCLRGEQMTVIFIFMALTIVLSIITVILQTKGHFGKKFVIKAIASFCFMIMGFTALTFVDKILTWHIGVLAGLLFGLMGDVFLATKGIVKGEYLQPMLLAGLLFFLTGHLVYIVVFLSLAGGFVYPLIAVLALLPTIVFILIKTKVIQPKPKAAIAPIMLYAVVIGLMLVSALNYIVLTKASTQGIIILIGAILFTLSDLLLGMYNFGNLDNRISLKNTIAFIYMPAYYIAQTLFALSIIF